MEASVSQEGTQATAAPEAPAQEAGTQQVPDVVTQRLDEISGRFDQFEPLLQQALAPQEQEAPEEQGSYNDFVDPEGGYLLDPEGFQTFTQQEIERATQERLREEVAPIQQQLQELMHERTVNQFEDLKYEFPQLGDEQFQKSFVPRVEAAANQMARELGLSPEHAQRLAVSPAFVRQQYLAGLAREQAQQGVPAGDQGVHLEGGSAIPGQPEADPKQEWLSGMQIGAQSGPFGRPLDQF